MKRNLFLLFTCTLLITSCARVRDTSSPLVYYNDLEKTLVWNDQCNNIGTVKKDPQAHTGKYVVKLDSVNKYGFMFRSAMGDLNNKPLKSAEASIWVKAKSQAARGALVMAVDSAGKYMKWEGKDIAPFIKLNEWVEIKHTILFDEKCNMRDNIFGFYLWNQSNEIILGDDMYIKFIE